VTSESTTGLRVAGCVFQDACLTSPTVSHRPAMPSALRHFVPIFQAAAKCKEAVRGQTNLPHHRPFLWGPPAKRTGPPFPVVPLPSVSVPLPNPLSVSTPITPVMEASSSPVVLFPACLQVIPAYRKTRPVQAFSVLQRYKIKTRLSSVSGYFFRLFLPYVVK